MSILLWNVSAHFTCSYIILLISLSESAQLPQTKCLPVECSATALRHTQCAITVLHSTLVLPLNIKDKKFDLKKMSLQHLLLEYYMIICTYWIPSNPQFTMTDLNVNQLSNKNSIDLPDYNVQPPGSHKGSLTAQGEWPVLQTEHSELHSHPRRNGLPPVSTLHHDTLHYLHPANYILAESGMPAEERKRLSI